MAPEVEVVSSKLGDYCCLLCCTELERVEVKVKVKKLLNSKCPNPGSSSGSSTSFNKLISHEQSSFVLFRHVLDLPPNIYTQINLAKNDTQIIKYCESCLTQLTHVHDLVAQLARIERELKEQKKEIELKICSSSKVDPSNPDDTSVAAAAAAGLPENERQEFMELRRAIFGGLLVVKPGSVRRTNFAQNQIIVEGGNLRYPSRVPGSPLQKNVSIRRIKSRGRGRRAANATKIVVVVDTQSDKTEKPARVRQSKTMTMTKFRSKSKSGAASAAATNQRFPRSRSAKNRDLLQENRENRSISADPSLATDALENAAAAAESEPSEIEILSDSEFCTRAPEVEPEVERVELEESPDSVPVPPKETPQQKRSRKKAGPKIYKCQFCPAKFAEMWYVKRHTMVHTGEKPFKCPSPHCSASFTQNRCLQAHVASCHVGPSCSQKQPVVLIKKHKCHLCPAMFTKKAGVKIHMLIHTGQKQFQCHLCPAKFTQQGGLSRHLAVHSGEKPFRCPSCPQTFKRNHDMRRHCKILHPEELDLSR